MTKMHRARNGRRRGARTAKPRRSLAAWRSNPPAPSSPSGSTCSLSFIAVCILPRRVGWVALSGQLLARTFTVTARKVELRTEEILLCRGHRVTAPQEEEGGAAQAYSRSARVETATA